MHKHFGCQYSRPIFSPLAADMRTLIMMGDCPMQIQSLGLLRFEKLREVSKLRLPVILVNLLDDALLMPIEAIHYAEWIPSRM